MSNSASQAAALAAFKSLGANKDSPTASNPKFKLPTPKSLNTLPNTPKRSHTRRPSLPKITTVNRKTTSPQKSSGTTSTPKSSVDTPTRKIRSIYDVNDLNLNTPTQPETASSMRSGIDYFTLPPESLHSSLHSPEATPTMKRSSSNHSNLTLNKARAHDTINNLKLSLSAKAAYKDPSSKRLSYDYAPQEMLKKIKQSITDKSVNSSNTDVSSKAHDRLHEIRESIKSKRIQTSIKNHALLEASGLLDEPFGGHSYTYGHHSNSGTTVDSESSNSTNLSMPEIITTLANGSDDEDEEEEDNEHEEDDWDGDDIDYYQRKAPYETRNASVDGNEMFQRPITPIISHSSTASPISPINVPPSSGASAREAALGSNESLHYIPNGRLKLQSFDSPRATSEERSKLTRKPPPTMESSSTVFDNDESDNERQKKLLGQTLTNDYTSRSSVDYGSSLSDSEAPDTANVSTTKLPQFPELEEKTHHHYLHPNVNNASKRGLFKKKFKLQGGDKIDLSGLDFDVTDPLSTPSSSRPVTPLHHQSQPVQLKTTMRKAQRKGKMFNEDKPWKHHTDLSYISENERKRYEGLWASNKGLYLTKVVTKLKGVCYDSNDNINEQKPEQQDASMRAAKLSSSHNMKANEKDGFNHYHNLDKAETDQLIAGVVVKRIWTRSKLPDETLESVWDLVDYRHDGTLNKQEFLVGMWLVDQCLYGRKLPKKVDQEIWASLESIGLNIVIRKKGKR